MRVFGFFSVSLVYGNRQYGELTALTVRNHAIFIAERGKKVESCLQISAKQRTSGK